SARMHVHILQPCAIALIHRPRPHTRRTNPPIDMTGDVTMPQKIIVMPSANRNGAYEGSTVACGSRDSGNGSLEMFGRIIAITPVLRVVREPDTSSRTWKGLLPDRPCTPAPTSAGRPLADRCGVSIPTAREQAARV